MTSDIRTEAIERRRSIRKYDRNKPVDHDTLIRLVRAAMLAPSARNLQPWQFIIITHREMLDSIPEVHPYASMMKEATAAILVCGDKSVDPNEFYLAQNGAAATQNILLEAWSNGLGSVWLGVYGREERMKAISERFALPGSLIPISLIALGHPMEEKPVPDRFRPDLIHWETYGATHSGHR